MTRMPAREGSTVAGVVLVYRPETTTAGSVTALASQVDEIFIVDNSASDQLSRDLRRAVSDLTSVRWLEQEGNIGVAAGFNAGLRAAIAAGHDEVVIFDQDSTVTPGFVSALRAARAATPRAGIIGPALRSAATGVVYRGEQGTGVAPTDVLISSGSLFSREVLEQIGLHDEPLFIDYVDHDICLRARRAGLRNLKVYTAILEHRLGAAEPVRLFGRRVFRSDYSLLRVYHASRNRVIVVRRYGFGRWFWADCWFTLKAWTKTLILERDRWAKLCAALQGAADGLRYPARERRW